MLDILKFKIKYKWMRSFEIAIKPQFWIFGPFYLTFLNFGYFIQHFEIFYCVPFRSVFVPFCSISFRFILFFVLFFIKVYFCWVCFFSPKKPQSLNKTSIQRNNMKAKQICTLCTTKNVDYALSSIYSHVNKILS